MKILHTADIHLNEFGDERWQALEGLITLGEKEAIDVFIIAGDLFDSNQEARQLYPQLNQLFQKAPFRTIIIRGNHDVRAYPEGVYLGEQVQLIENPFEPVMIEKVAFWGLPFQDVDELKLLRILTEMARHVTPDQVNILLFHGELLNLAGFGEAYGEEGKKHYMPVHLEYFRELPWQYILAGHFHTNCHMMKVEKDKYFVYPGTPVSISRKETGPRFVNILEVGSAPQFLEVPFFYYHPLEIRLDPLGDHLPVEEWEKRIQETPDNAFVLVSLTGYINSSKWGLTETELVSRVEQLVDSRGELVEKNIRDVGEIFEKDLFRKFQAVLEQRPLPPDKKKAVWELGLKALMEVL